MVDPITMSYFQYTELYFTIIMDNSSRGKVSN